MINLDEIIESILPNHNLAFMYGHELSACKESMREAIRQALELAANLWIDVSSDLPEIGEYVLVIVGEDTILKGRLMNNGWTAFFADGEKLVGDQRPVTKWKPLDDKESITSLINKVV